MMLASSIPTWKAELLEKKRSEKMKSNTVPEWKRDLLKRLQSKAEATKLKQDSETVAQEDKLVLDEHILKISENVFVRQEHQRKMSLGKTLSPNATDLDKPGIHVIHGQDMVIIESENSQNEQVVKERETSREILDVELPSAGIVNRLKDKFKNSTSTERTAIPLSTLPYPYRRSRTSDDLSHRGFNGQQESDNVFSLSPSQRSEFLYANDSYTPAMTSTQTMTGDAKESIDFTMPTASNSRKISNDFSAMPFHKVTSPTRYRKITPPVLSPKRKVGLIKAASVDTSCLHAPGSTPPNKIEIVHLEQRPSSTKTTPSDSVTEFAKEITSLHSGNYNTPLSTEPNASTVTEFKIARLSFTDTSKMQDIPKPPLSRKMRSSVNIDHSAVASNRENHPEVPKRRQISYKKTHTAAFDSSSFNEGKTLSSIKSRDYANDFSQKKDEWKIIDLGRTTMEPSLLNNKGAIAANEIMKVSKTFRVVPKKKDYQTPGLGSIKLITNAPSENIKIVENLSILTNDQELVHSDGFESRNSVRNIKEIYEKAPETSRVFSITSTADPKTLQKDMSQTYLSETTPVVVKKNVVSPEIVAETDKHPRLSPEVQTMPTSHERKESSDFAANKTSEKIDLSPFVLNSNTVEVDTGPSLSKDSEQSIFGTKTNKYGGKTFTIDPSKYKPKAKPANKAPTQTTKKSITPISSNTIVITPKVRRETAASITNEQTKGKRKLTVDQIQVIGGYVKLEHSTLAKSNKISKNIHVRFEENHLESLYQYPSERSLLNEDSALSLNQRMILIGNNEGKLKESQIGSFTPKYLLSMKEQLEIDEDEDTSPLISEVVEKLDVASSDATPLADDDATAFSISSSNDLLF